MQLLIRRDAAQVAAAVVRGQTARARTAAIQRLMLMVRAAALRMVGRQRQTFRQLRERRAALVTIQRAAVRRAQRERAALQQRAMVRAAAAAASESLAFATAARVRLIQLRVTIGTRQTGRAAAAAVRDRQHIRRAALATAAREEWAAAAAAAALAFMHLEIMRAAMAALA